MVPKLSIITISYNDKLNLDKTIASVCAQSFRDFEFLVVDGGSTDGSFEVIQANQACITKWVSEPDQGIYDAMNKGLDMASGEYVIFMNAGDTFYANYTLSTIPFGQYPEADIFYGETMMIGQGGEEKGLRPKKLPHKLTWKHFLNGMVVCHQAIIVRRSIAPKFNLNYKLSADVEWVLLCLKKSRQTVFTHSIIARYLEGGASVQHHQHSLAERFLIMTEHFGLYRTLWSHFRFLIQTVLVKIGFRPAYRKNYLA